MLDKEYYESYSKRFNSIYSFLRRNSKPSEEVAFEICNLRKYDVNRMSDILISSGFLKLPEKVDLSVLFENEYSDLGLLTSGGDFLLRGRYIFPVRDMIGNVVALIGWYPDEKRYITTPSALFSKSGMFYGMEQLGVTGIGKKYFLVEGIFDALSLRALGYNAVAQMGISSSNVKKVLYGLFDKLVGIPDVDSQGRKVILKNSWELPYGSSYLTWVDENSKGTVKDIDALCKIYEESIMKDILDEVLLDTTRVITYKLS